MTDVRPISITNDLSDFSSGWRRRRKLPAPHAIGDAGRIQGELSKSKLTRDDLRRAPPDLSPPRYAFQQISRHCVALM